MSSVTVSVDQLIEWTVGGYVLSHILFGLVTHYHSAWQVRKHNNSEDVQLRVRERGYSSDYVGNFKMLCLFIGRMTLGLPWFVVRHIVSPIGNRWHMTPVQIVRWNE